MPFVAKLLPILALPPRLLGAVLSGLLEILPPGLEVLSRSSELNATLNLKVVLFFVFFFFSVDTVMN